MTIFAKTLAVGKNGSAAINALFADLVGQLNAGLKVYTVATLPAAATVKGQFVQVSNGAAGQPCLAYSDGTSFKQVALGAAPSAS
jgi:hypothetical protein